MMVGMEKAPWNLRKASSLSKKCEEALIYVRQRITYILIDLLAHTSASKRFRAFASNYKYCTSTSREVGKPDGKAN